MKPSYVYICHMKGLNTPSLTDLLQYRPPSDELEICAIGVRVAELGVTGNAKRKKNIPRQ